MNLLLLVSVAVVAAAARAAADEELLLRYHELAGVPAAARLRDAEARAPRNDTPAARVTGGLASYLGEHKFFAGLLITLTNGQTSVCGGSLVSVRSVLTAAHCWNDGYWQGRSILVVLGSTTLFSGGTRQYAYSVLAHPNYVPGVAANDLALLSIPATSGTYIRPIALPSSLSESYYGYTAEVIGFGVTSDGGAITSGASLRDAFVPVISNTQCADTYGSVVTAAHLCTSGANGRNPCGGDSGGPLILYSSAGNDVLIGVVAFGSTRGCQVGLPSGYSRVTYHYWWIRNNM